MSTSTVLIMTFVAFGVANFGAWGALGFKINTAFKGTVCIVLTSEQCQAQNNNCLRVDVHGRKTKCSSVEGLLLP